MIVYEHMGTNMTISDGEADTNGVALKLFRSGGGVGAPPWSLNKASGGPIRRQDSCSDC